MSAITAKVTLQNVQHGPDQSVLTFVPDYQDGRNKEWSLYTPALSLTMTVRNELVGRFEDMGPILLTFTAAGDQE